MRHLFSSGEILHNENVKELKEGKLVAEYIVYGEIKEGSKFTTVGNIDGKKVKVYFSINPKGLNRVLYKKSMNILMQSDIYQSDWLDYSIEWE